MSTWIWTPDKGYGTKAKAGVVEAPFGDGYTARTATGINSISREIPVRLTGRSAAEIRAAVQFLEARKGVEAFDFTPHLSGVTGKYICQEWEDTYEHEGNASLTATFKRVYES